MPDDMLPAMQEQIAIGWDNILFGRLSTKWMKLQHKHLASKRSRKSPERWAADMTYRLLQISHKLWMTRNGILHERDEQGLLLAEGQTLAQAITERHGRGTAALLPEDHHYLDQSVERILAMSPSDKYSWLGNIKMAHKFMRVARKNPITRMRQSMESWLSTGYLVQPTSTDDDDIDIEDEEEDT